MQAGCDNVSFVFSFLLFCSFFHVKYCFLFVVGLLLLLQAMIYLDQDSLSQVIEETEASKLLGEEVRRSILQKLPKLSDPETELKVLFQQISSEGSEHLT